MTKSNVHAILGELHRLLGVYPSSDFLDATNYSGISTSMREALRALAREAKSGPTGGSHRRQHPAQASIRARPDRTPSTQGKAPDVLDLLRRSPNFRSTASLLAFAKDIGIKLSLRPKEGREKLARRVAIQIEELSESRKNEVINDLRGAGNGQTEGWLEVIRGSNH